MNAKLNIGCGYRILPGYENADINPDLPNIDIVCSLDKIPVEDGVFDEVFASHCIEHVPFALGQKALAEWLRVLNVGGVAIIDTPNLRRNAGRYIADDDSWKRDFDNLTPAEQERLKLNGVPNKTLWFIFKAFSSEHLYDVHYLNYDWELLSECCKLAGFSKVDLVQTEPSLMVKAWK